MRTLLLAAAFTATLPVLAQESYTLVPSHTIPSFEIRHHGVSLQRGLFTRSQGKALLDPVGGGGRIEVTAVEATGQLTLLGVKRPVTVKIRDFSCTTHFLRRIPLCGADVHTTIRRSEFGMTFGLPNLIGDEVKLAIQVEGFRD